MPYADVGVRLARLGPKGRAPGVAAQLLALLRGAGGSSTQVPTGEPEAAAQLLAAAGACLARARWGPLPAAGAHPLQPVLEGMQARISYTTHAT